jgi:hypothetical protein
MPTISTHPAAPARRPHLRIRPGPLSSAQLRARRNHLWLYLFETGIPDPVTGRPRPQAVAEIAASSGVGEQTVRDGVAEARRLRGAIADARPAL